MIDWRLHQLWLGLLALAIVIGVSHQPVIGLAQQNAAQKLEQLRAQNEKATQALQQLQDDISAAEQMKTEIDAGETDRFLAPADRLRTAQILENRAAEFRLSRFTYILSPEQKTTIDTIGAGKQTLATSKLTVNADAPSDIDAYAFLDALRHTLPGRFTLRQLSLQRIDAVDAPITEANLRLSASGEWLSNGASKNPAEQE